MDTNKKDIMNRFTNEKDIMNGYKNKKGQNEWLYK